MKAHIVVSILLMVAIFSSVALASPVYKTQKSPTSCSSSFWLNCANAFADGGGAATVTSVGSTAIWQRYGFNFPNSYDIVSVAVRTDFWSSPTWSTILVQVSNNGGINWGPVHGVNSTTSERSVTIDVSNDFLWTPQALNDTNFKVRITSAGVAGTTRYLDWIPVTVGWFRGW